VLACTRSLLREKMLVVERLQTLRGSEFRALPLSLQTFCDAQDVLTLMKKHVASDGSVDNLHVELGESKIQVLQSHELRIVAHLAAAYNNSLVAEHLKYEKDLYGKPYDTPEEQAQPRNSPEPMQRARARQTTQPAKSTRSRNMLQKTDEWDVEISGDRYVFDVHYEQNEDLLPWKDTRQEEKFGWYM